MATSTLYPPHPAEGHASSLQFEELTAIKPWPTAATTESAVPLHTASAPSGLDRRMHWLAYDPSTNGQYPLD